MTVFINVVDRPQDSLIVSNPCMAIYRPEGILYVYNEFLTVFINWDLNLCIDFFKAVYGKSHFVMNVERKEIVFSECSLELFD